MAVINSKGALLPLHDLANVNTVLGMLYDENGVYRAAFEPAVFYNTILMDSLKYGEENYVHLKYAENLSIRRGEKVARFRRWAGLTPTLRPLKEGIPPASDKHAHETIEVGNVFSFGRWSEYTDTIDTSIISEVKAERSLQYGELANQTKELYARKTWLASPNEFYSNFKSFDTLGFGDFVTLDDLRFLIARMRRMMVKPIGGKFNYICSTEFINGLIDDPRVKQYMAIEQTTGKLWGSGEPFDMFELSFIPTMLDEFAYPDTEFPGVYELANGDEVMRMYTVSGSTVYYLDVHQDFVVTGSDATAVKAKKTKEGVTYLADGTAMEDHVVWDIPLNTTALTADTVKGTGEATSAKVVLKKSTMSRAIVNGIDTTSYTDMIDASASFATYNTLLAAGAFMQLPVHRGLLFGMEATLKLTVEGVTDAAQIITKELGSAGTLDPLNQRQSIGFKVDGFGLAIKRPEAICVTYGIPKFAELAALTNRMVSGDWELLDGLGTDSDYANYINAAGEGVLRVDGVNRGGFPGKPLVNGKKAGGTDNVKSVELYPNPLDDGGNDPKSNIK